MGVLSRMSTLIKIKVSKLLDKAEDPRETLDYSYEKQLQMMQNVKRGIVEVATSKRRLELQRNKLQDSVTKLDGQAKAAVAAGRDDLARMALERKAQAQQQMDSLQAQSQSLDQEQAKLEEAESRLRMKLESFRTQKEVVKARYSAAEAQVKIGESVSGLSEEMADVGMALDRANEKTEQMQARAGAIDELISTGALEDFTSSGQDQIDRELGKITIKDSVDAELAALKAQVGAPEQPKSLSEGQPQ
ncbi:MAG TPA: PspA/IM30 family protein [Thermomicrobiaceae bacterium]|nr:PspA/IM30 family protein [Thermomicrobiaceae bacterium]